MDREDLVSKKKKKKGRLGGQDEHRDIGDRVTGSKTTGQGLGN